jgi:hypothetical protein
MSKDDEIRLKSDLAPDHPGIVLASTFVDVPYHDPGDHPMKRPARGGQEALVGTHRLHVILPESLWKLCEARSCDLDLDMSQYVRHLMRADLKAAKEAK